MGAARRRLRGLGFAMVTSFIACGRTGLVDDHAPSPNDGPRDASTVPSLDAPISVIDASLAEAGPCRRDAGSAGGGPAWLYDECLWERVPLLDACGVVRARLPDPAYPVPAYAACGPGCSVMTPNNLLDYVPKTTGYFSAELAWSDGSDWYTSVQIGGLGVPHIRQIVALDPFRVVAAFQTRNSQDAQGYAQCQNYDVFDGFGPSVMEVWEHSIGGNTETDFHGVYYFARSRYRESANLEALAGIYDRGVGYGKPLSGFAFTATHWSYWIKGELYFSDDWTTPPPHATKVSAPGAFLRKPFGDYLYWMEGKDAHRTKVRAWSPTSGALELVGRPSEIWLFDAVWGADGLFWIEAKSPSLGKYADFQVWKKENPLDPTAIATHVADLGGTHSAGIVAQDGYFATVLCTTQTFDNNMICPLEVLRLVDGKRWSLARPEAQRWWQAPIKIDSREILVGDVDQSQFWGMGSHKLYRFQIAELDALEQMFSEP